MKRVSPLPNASSERRLTEHVRVLFYFIIVSSKMWAKLSVLRIADHRIWFMDWSSRWRISATVHSIKGKAVLQAFVNTHTSSDKLLKLKWYGSIKISDTNCFWDRLFDYGMAAPLSRKVFKSLFPMIIVATEERGLSSFSQNFFSNIPVIIVIPLCYSHFNTSRTFK